MSKKKKKKKKNQQGARQMAHASPYIDKRTAHCITKRHKYNTRNACNNCACNDCTVSIHKYIYKYIVCRMERSLIHDMCNVCTYFCAYIIMEGSATVGICRFLNQIIIEILMVYIALLHASISSNNDFHETFTSFRGMPSVKVK